MSPVAKNSPVVDHDARIVDLVQQNILSNNLYSFFFFFSWNSPSLSKYTPHYLVYESVCEILTISLTEHLLMQLLDTAHGPKDQNLL